MYLCSNMTSVGLNKIGEEMGKRDHTTVLHGSKKIASEIKKSDSTRNTVEILKKKLNPS
jgi:chromosomal replication initiator protein